MKTSLSLTDKDRRIAEGLQRRLGFDSLSETVRFALRHAWLEGATLPARVVDSDGSGPDRAAERPAPAKHVASVGAQTLAAVVCSGKTRHREARRDCVPGCGGSHVQWRRAIDA